MRFRSPYKWTPTPEKKFQGQLLINAQTGQVDFQVSDYATNQARRLFRSGLSSTRDPQLAPTSSVNL